MNIDEVFQSLLVSDANTLGLSEIILALVLPFLLVFPIVAVYRRVQRNNNFSSSFILALFLFAVLSSQITLLIGNNIARAFGLVGALSIIRFRSALKDPLDAVFIFWALAIGMASGTGYYTLGVASVIIGAAMLLGLKALGIEQPKYLDSVIKVVATKDDQVRANVEASLQNAFRECKKVNEYFDSQADKKTYVYTLKRRQASDVSAIETQIRSIEGVAEIHHLNQESNLFLETRH